MFEIRVCRLFLKLLQEQWGVLITRKQEVRSILKIIPNLIVLINLEGLETLQSFK